MRGPVILRHGDEIDLAGEVTFVYRVDSARPGRWLAALAAVLLVAAGAWWSRSSRGGGPTRSGSARSPWLARGSQRSARAIRSTARSKLKSAAGLLYKNGKLDDFERARVMMVAMERIDERLDEDVDLPALYERVLEASRPAESRRIGVRAGRRLSAGPGRRHPDRGLYRGPGALALHRASPAGG